MAGTVAHVGAGGLMPSPSAVLVVLLVSIGAGHVVLSRRASAVRVVLVLVGTQSFTHAGFSLLAGHQGDEPAAHGAGHGTHVTGHTHAEAAAHGPVEMVLASLHHLAEEGVGMVLAHLAATAALGLWLAWGERALLTVIALLAAPILTPWRALVAASRAAVANLAHVAARSLSPTSRDRLVPLIDLVVAHTVVRRGPPFSLAT